MKEANYTHTCGGCGALIRYLDERGAPVFVTVSGRCPCGNYQGTFVPVPRPAQGVTVQTVELSARNIH